MHVSTCPSDETLADLILGKIGELQESPVVEHIQHCDECREKLSQLESSGSDSLLDQLRQPHTSDPFFNEPDCHWATSMALGAIAGSSDEETTTKPYQLPLDLGDYRLLEAIAHGGMGIVYRAQHLRLGRDVAVKIISGKRLSDKRATQRFEAEMRALGQLSHPNIVSALDARELSGQPVLVMEYVDGLDLSQIVDKLGPLTPEAVAAVGRATAAALEYANRNGLVHRDVKPSNIMLNQAGEVKLLDLGLARLQVGQGAEGDATATGLALGTADYMSPEQIHDARNVDIRSDLYSLGCTLYKLLTGTAPYSSTKFSTNFAKLSAHVSDEPILVPDEFRQRSPKIVELIEKLTSKNREDRPSSAQEVALQLEPFASQSELSQLVQLARSVGPLETASQSKPLLAASALADTNHSWPPRWLTTTIALGGVPLGIVLGVWLTIKQADGTTNRIELPANANAMIDPEGNVAVELPANKPQSPLYLGSIMDASIDESQQLALGNANSQLGTSNGIRNASGNSAPDTDREVNTAMKAVSGATSPIYRGYPMDAWMNLYEKDRNVDIAISAATAMVHLADTPEQKKFVAKLLLHRCRIWGGYVTDDGGREASPKWMKMFTSEYPRLMPYAGLACLIDELEQSNANSQAACQTILEMEFDTWFSNDWYGMERNPNLAELESLMETLISQQQKNTDRSGYAEKSTKQLAMAIALNAKTPFADLPPMLQVMSQTQWDQLTSLPTDSVDRQNSNTFLSRLRDIAWQPYWETLPTNDRNPLHVLHQLFQDQAHTQLLLDSSHLLDTLPAPTSDELVAIKQLLVQRLADSDFDDRGSSNKLWPQIANWLSRVESFSVEESQAMLDTVSETEDQAIRLIGTPLYSKGAPRSVFINYAGAAEILEGVRITAVEQVLERGCEQLITQFKLEDHIEYPRRIPGGLGHSQSSPGGGGMF